MTILSQIENSRCDFDSLEIGERYLSARRTITEADIVAFAGLSGDFNALHTDAVHAASHRFGQRAAHGMLILSIVSGLSANMPMSRAMAAARIALLGVQCRWIRPVFIGDTIHVEVHVAEKRPLDSRPDEGIVSFERVVRNQDNDIVLKSCWDTLLRRRERQNDSQV